MNNPTFSDIPVPVNSSQCHCVNILFWNIRGITDKLQNRHVCEYICQHDIVCSVESMLDPQKSIQFANYTAYNFARTLRHKKAKRSSGGIAILIANWLNKRIEIKRVNECLVWIIFKDCININTNKKLMVGVVYVRPIDSSYIGIKQDIFDIIELEYSKYVNNHDVFLCWDFNARTSNLSDFITDEYTAFNGGQLNFVSSDILADSQRYNMDTKANTYGKLLLELCKNTGFIIANGRLYQDKHRGSFTFFNRNGSSVIEYMLFEPNCLSMIKKTLQLFLN